MILFLTRDLFFIPVLQAAAGRCDAEMVTAFSIDAPQATGLPAGETTACIIDLSSVAVDEMQNVVDSLRARFPHAQVVAFGPHVQEQRLQSAHGAGCDQVLTRGQLNKQIDQLMANWAAPPPS